jgi:hypothetical protein
MRELLYFTTAVPAVKSRQLSIIITGIHPADYLTRKQTSGEPMEINSPTRLFALVLLAALSLSGCGGGGATMEARTTTTGQELIDLDNAYKQGLLTEKEYESKKKEIMKRK